MAKVFTSGANSRLAIQRPVQVAGKYGALYYVAMTRTGGAASERRSPTTGFLPHFQVEFEGDLSPVRSAVGDSSGKQLLNSTTLAFGLTPIYVPAEASVSIAGGDAGVVYSVDTLAIPSNIPPWWVPEIDVQLTGPATISIPRFATHIRAMSAFSCTLTAFGLAETRATISSGETYLGLCGADPTATLGIGGGAGTVSFSFIYRSVPGLFSYASKRADLAGMGADLFQGVDGVLV